MATLVLVKMLQLIDMLMLVNYLLIMQLPNHQSRKLPRGAPTAAGISVRQMTDSCCCFGNVGVHENVDTDDKTMKEESEMMHTSQGKIQGLPPQQQESR